MLRSDVFVPPLEQAHRREEALPPMQAKIWNAAASLELLNRTTFVLYKLLHNLDLGLGKLRALLFSGSVYVHA